MPSNSAILAFKVSIRFFELLAEYMQLFFAQIGHLAIVPSVGSPQETQRLFRLRFQYLYLAFVIDVLL